MRLLKRASVGTKDKKSFNLIRWSLIAIVFVLTLITNLISFGELNITLESIVTLLIFTVAWLHGTERYGMRNMLAFLVITWVVSNSLEALSISTGFPFGDYHYTLPGPQILGVPLIIMPSYFGTGYLAWTLSLILTGQYSKKLQGKQILTTPLIATFIMVMWDVVMDPLETNIYKSWVWKEEGNYFGVPITNYLGWFLVVYIFMQIFALFISKYDTREKVNESNKLFWLEATAVFAVQGLSYLLKSFTGNGNIEIYSSMGLISIFTMIFVAILSAVSISNSRGLKNKRPSDPGALV